MRVCVASEWAVETKSMQYPSDPLGDAGKGYGRQRYIMRVPASAVGHKYASHLIEDGCHTEVACDQRTGSPSRFRGYGVKIHRHKSCADQLHPRRGIF